MQEEKKVSWKIQEKIKTEQKKKKRKVISAPVEYAMKVCTYS